MSLGLRLSFYLSACLSVCSLYGHFHYLTDPFVIVVVRGEDGARRRRRKSEVVASGGSRQTMAAATSTFAQLKNFCDTFYLIFMTHKTA